MLFADLLSLHHVTFFILVSDVQMTSSLAGESELILQLVTDHSMKLFISEMLALLNETSHSGAVLSVREKNGQQVNGRLMLHSW